MERLLHAAPSRLEVSARASKYHLDRTDPDHSSHDAAKSAVANPSHSFCFVFFFLLLLFIFFFLMKFIVKSTRCRNFDPSHRLLHATFLVDARDASF